MKLLKCTNLNGFENSIIFCVLNQHWFFTLGFFFTKLRPCMCRIIRFLIHFLVWVFHLRRKGPKPNIQGVEDFSLWMEVWYVSARFFLPFLYTKSCMLFQMWFSEKFIFNFQIASYEKKVFSCTCRQLQEKRRKCHNK